MWRQNEQVIVDRRDIVFAAHVGQAEFFVLPLANRTISHILITDEFLCTQYTKHILINEIYVVMLYVCIAHLYDRSP